MLAEYLFACFSAVSSTDKLQNLSDVRSLMLLSFDKAFTFLFRYCNSMSSASTLRTYFRLGTLPFWAIHLCCFAAFFVDFSWWYVGLAVAGYGVRMFFVTGIHHRYFSHKSYSTSRVFQFVLAFLAQTAVQKGVLWWAAHHRHHHTHSDQEDDLHSPQDGFWWSHIGWFLSEDHNDTESQYIRDLMRYPELVWLNKYYLVPAVAWGMLMFVIAGIPGLVWGLCISTVALWHGTFTINSLSHLWGWQRYKTTDTSRNNPILAIITLGEGWHNNHHRFQSSARNGFFWWEIDITYYILKLLSWVGLIWDLRPVPAHLLDHTNETWIKNTLATPAQRVSQKVSQTAQQVLPPTPVLENIEA
jgi:stearoyl-CoA desaturase (delta-9 desaturase)